MSVQQPMTESASRPPIVVGAIIGSVPILLAVIAGYGIVHCRMGPMSFGYCTGSEEGTWLTFGAAALGGWAVELLAMIVCLTFRHLRRVGIGLVIMSALFPALTIMAVYTEAFLIIGR